MSEGGIGDQVIAAQAVVFSSDSLQAYLTRLYVHSQCTQLVWFASDDLVPTPIFSNVVSGIAG